MKGLLNRSHRINDVDCFKNNSQANYAEGTLSKASVWAKTLDLNSIFLALYSPS